MSRPSPTSSFESKHFHIRSERDVLIFAFLDTHLARERDLKTIFGVLKEKLTLLDDLKLTLDFQAVEFVSSSLLGQLVGLKKWVDQHGGKMNICHVCEDVHETLRITHLDDFFMVYTDMDEALKAISDPRHSKRISRVLERLDDDARGH